MKCANLAYKIQNMDKLWSQKFHNDGFLKCTHTISLHAYVQVPRKENFYFDCMFSPITEFKWNYIAYTTSPWLQSSMVAHSLQQALEAAMIMGGS